MVCKLGIVAHWKINQAAITQKYCVNKAKPALKCNGKCHLKKQLQQAEIAENGMDKNEKPFPYTAIYKIKVSDFIVANNEVVIPFFHQQIIEKCFANSKQSIYHYLHFHHNLRPPIV
jgi:autonomous glycyl radical cofactor GrcA